LLDTLALGRSQDLILDKIDRLKAENAELDYAIVKENAILFHVTQEDIADYLTYLRDFAAKSNDIKEKALFVDTFVYRLFYHKDESLTILINMKDNERGDKPPRGIVANDGMIAKEKELIPFSTYKSLLAEW
jgi:hypothetical protein